MKRISDQGQVNRDAVAESEKYDDFQRRLDSNMNGITLVCPIHGNYKTTVQKHSQEGGQHCPKCKSG